MKNSTGVTPPPIHINGKGSREVGFVGSGFELCPSTLLAGSVYSHSADVVCFQLQTLVAENSLTYSHSASSHLDSSPESSEAGADGLLSRTGETGAAATSTLLFE